MLSDARLELGKKSEYDAHYDKTKLFAIPRSGKREEIGVDPNNLPFFGFDRWNHYEVSWLNGKGKPVVALAEIAYPCESENIIESKSMKLYFNSLNNTQFYDVKLLQETIKKDLEEQVKAEVFVTLTPLNAVKDEVLKKSFDGTCVDDLDVECSIYTVNPEYLLTTDEEVEETLHSDLLKSNCLVTEQPDWGSVQIVYKGKKICHEGLLKYIVSFRNHNEFHEQCIERIFADIMKYCKPSELTVHGAYTRRGGLDINPYRSTKKINYLSENARLSRQ